MHPLSRLLLLGGFCAAHATAATEAIDALVRDAWQHSPELRSAHARWTAARERPAQAEALPDPTLSYTAFVQRMDTRQRFALGQMVPDPVRRQLATATVRQSARVAEAALHQAALRVRAAVWTAAADWVLVRGTQATLRETLALTEAQARVVLQHYRNNRGSLTDVLRLQAEIATIETELAAWSDQTLTVLARLNALRGRPSAAPPDALLEALETLPTLAPVPGDFPPDLEGHPALIALAAQTRQAEVARDLAQRADRPDWMVGLEFMDNRGMARDELAVMVSVNLPIWRTRVQSLRREALAAVRAAAADQRAGQLDLAAEATAAWQELRAAERRHALYVGTVLPQARQTLAVLSAEYLGAGTDFTAVIEARRAVLAIEQATLVAHADSLRRRAEWERATAPFLSLAAITSENELPRP
jgi:cobalt-zinc-cadmium efflux system outer membrane protein